VTAPACLDPCLGQGLSWTAGAEVLQTSACPLTATWVSLHVLVVTGTAIRCSPQLCHRRTSSARVWKAPTMARAPCIARADSTRCRCRAPEQSGRGPGVSARPNDVDGHVNPRDRRNLSVPAERLRRRSAVGLDCSSRSPAPSTSVLREPPREATALTSQPQACHARSRVRRSIVRRRPSDAQTLFGFGEVCSFLL
jgi:hypothetical protein